MVNEKVLKQRLAKGSSKAFDDIFRMYHTHLCNYIFTILLDVDDSKEVAQQCFVQLWEKRSQAETIGSLKSYLFKSAHNMCLNRFKHEKIKARYASEEQYLLQEIYLEHNEDPELKLAEEIKSAVEQLPRKNKEVFKLRYFNGYDTQEVSEELDISVRTVETHISKAFRLLRDKLSHLLHLFVLVALVHFHQL